MVNIFVVIVNYNGISDTKDCLKSLKKLQITNYKLQIIVVDNGSQKDDVAHLKREKHIHLIVNKENTGFTGGNNAGIKYSLENGADYILLLNNDTIVKEDLVEKFLEASKKYPKAGIFSPKIYFYPGYEFYKDKYSKAEEGKVIWYAGGILDWNNVYGSNYGVDDTDIGQYEKVYEPDFATGACMFIRAEVFKKIGLLNEQYFLYMEDVEFSQRAKRAGFKILQIPVAIVWHKVSRSSAIGGQLNDYFITRNRLQFGLRYAPFRSKVALIRESIKLLNSGREWQRKGVFDFFTGKLGKGSWI